jgi:serpin B
MRTLGLLLLGVTIGAVACDTHPAVVKPPSSDSATGATPSAGPTPTSEVKSMPGTPIERPPQGDVARFATSSNAFGFDLYRKIAPAKGNLIFSPASITTALAMTYLGAKGETLQEIKRVFHFEGLPSDVATTSGRLAQSLQAPGQPITLRIANRLFGEKSRSFERPYLDAARVAFGAALEPTDFRNASEPSRVHINEWAEQQTEKRIKDLVPRGLITSDTQLVLVNAIYFLGDWADGFSKGDTAAEPFATDGTASDATRAPGVPTMHKTGTFRFVAKDGVKALEMPYKGGQLTALVVLPDRVDGLPDLERALDPAKLGSLVNAMRSQPVAISLPRFQIGGGPSITLKEQLSQLGMPLAFNPSKADFTGIANPSNPAERVSIGEVVHQGFVRVDEKGTEAAAATAVVMPPGAAAPQPAAAFKADHPFLFFIRDSSSGLLLFMGRVAAP